MNARTQTRPQSPEVDQKSAANNVLALAPSRLPLAPSVAREFEINAPQWRVLVDQIFPTAKTTEAIMMALSYCRSRNLDIFKKPVHIVPMWSSALGKMVETVWPGIAEIRTTAARTGEYAGIDEVAFGDMIERTFKGRVKNDGKWEEISKTVRFPEWASVVVYRWVKGHKAAFHTKIFWEETYASMGKTDVPNDMWARRPRGQFDKCVEAAALRKAFPEEVGSMYAAEEMEGRVIDHEASERVSPQPPPKPPAPPAPPTMAAAPIESEPVGETTEAQFVLGDFLEQIETGLAGAKDETQVEEIWNDFDAPAVLETNGHADMIDTAFAIRDRRLSQLSTVAAG
ncbi:phage recombination protein Bet [Ensifer sp. ENS07]|uniref:phage recombination protein Bet n=1 Tax=Ensifer sp. ENS07 TaxID=2769274 RepID=UPI0017850295|nr:phage recombination protein Bet [Ensifer sp. ENS07]MBD9635430.1 phage recombination protein Bet [Ensifer sp. ENS07]